MNITIELGKHLDTTVFSLGLIWAVAYVMGKGLGGGKDKR